MKADPRFLKKPKSFWAAIRTLGEECGYTKKGAKRKKPSRSEKLKSCHDFPASNGQIKIPTIIELEKAYSSLSLDSTKLRNAAGDVSVYANEILEYCEYRADVLNSFVEPRLMNGIQAEELYNQLKRTHNPQSPMPLNKQGGKKKVPNYFTGIVNTLIESSLAGQRCDYNPRALTTVTRQGLPVRTLARQIDGAFPSSINPIAVWEIKEYYYTTTFGSRVADGVYETLLDGMELEELSAVENHQILHYLMVDAHYTWWCLGRSYLCRIIDMLHMGYVDEVFFGREVVDALPAVAKTWLGIPPTESRRGTTP